MNAKINDTNVVFSDVIPSTKSPSMDDLLLEHREERDMFRFILGNHRDPVFLIKIEEDYIADSFVDFNKFFCDSLGYTRDELFQLNHISIYAPENISSVETNIRKHHSENNLIWEAVVQKKDGQKVTFEIKSYVFKNERHNLLFAFLHDISSYKGSIQELQNKKSLLKQSESIGRMGYWEYDAMKDKLWVSEGAKAIFGLDEVELSLKDVYTIYFTEYSPNVDKMFETLNSNGGKYEVEFKIHRRNDGNLVYIRSHTEYDPRLEKYYGIIQDLTLQRKVEDELIKARDKAEESDRLKAAFVSNMSHEIRTPMNGIVGFAHLLTETDLDIATREEYKEGIQLCCNQLLSRVNDILDIAKIESGQVNMETSQVNINELIIEIFEKFSSVAEKKNLDFRINPENTISEQTLKTDKTKLAKIITNLIDNAFRFTHSGFVEFGYKVLDSSVEFYVKDTGIGISHFQHEIIFQPFCQADIQISQEYGGTGLGLTIAKTYVEMMGGSIWLESQPGIGTTFFFTLPDINSEKNPILTSLVRKKTGLLKTSLIVEDNEMNYIYLKALLEPLGFKVLWAKDGNEAIEMALSNHEIDLVLMDIRLPYTDGYEATKTIKKKRPDLPIIAQSAYALTDERTRAIESGCDGYVAKPIYKDEFRKVLSTFFEI
jgi:PAS domain S-box-containing protein